MRSSDTATARKLDLGAAMRRYRDQMVADGRVKRFDEPDGTWFFFPSLTDEQRASGEFPLAGKVVGRD